MNLAPKGTLTCNYEHYNPEIIKYLLDTVKQLQNEVENIKRTQLIQKQDHVSQMRKITHVETRHKRLVDTIESKSDGWIDQQSKRWLASEVPIAPNKPQVDESPSVDKNAKSTDFVIQPLSAPSTAVNPTKPTTLFIPNNLSDEDVMHMISQQNSTFFQKKLKIERFDPNSTQFNSLLQGLHTVPKHTTSQPEEIKEVKEIMTYTENTAPKQDVKIEVIEEYYDDSFQTSFTSTSNDDLRFPKKIVFDVSELEPSARLTDVFEHVIRKKANKYSAAEIDQVFSHLSQIKDYEILLELLDKTPATGDPTHNQLLNRTKCSVYFQQKKFNELYTLIQSFEFDQQHHSFLQHLWHHALYTEEQERLDADRRSKKMARRILGPVDKYRIRKKFQLPATIWDGMPIKKGYRESSREIMKQHYEINSYPSLEQRRCIADQSGLNMDQVKNWFKNRRKRESDRLGTTLTGGPNRPEVFGYQNGIMSSSSGEFQRILPKTTGMTNAIKIRIHAPGTIEPTNTISESDQMIVEAHDHQVIKLEPDV